MGANSVQQAEQRALEDENESQISQEILEAYMTRFGVRLLSSSPPKEAIPLPISRQITALRGKPRHTSSARKPIVSGSLGGLTSDSRPKPEKSDIPASCSDLLNMSKQTRDVSALSPPNPPLPVQELELGSAPGCENRAVSLIHGGEQPQKTLQNCNAVNKTAEADAKLAKPSAGPVKGPSPPLATKVLNPPWKRREKMDSFQSPTQSNDGRSYEQYLPSSAALTPPTDAPPSPRRILESNSHEEPTLVEDDASAVNFNFVNTGDADRTTSPIQHDSGFIADRTTSPTQHDSGFIDFGSMGWQRIAPSRNRPPPPFPQLPETPVAPQNPFRQQNRAQLLPPSQLFGGTQFSSAVKLASPTSSRPSPDNFQHNSISPNVAISSPLKARGLRSTPLALATSSPGIPPGTTSTVLLQDGPSSPPNADLTKTPVIPDSQKYSLSRKLSVTDPMSTYEPMSKSQERRSTSELRSNFGDSDDGEDSIVRRRKARLRKAAALNRLSAISFARPIKSDDIEVPSTNKRKRRSPAEDYLAQCHGKNVAGDDSDAQETVADSQENHPPTVEPSVPPTDDDPTQSDVGDITEPEADSLPSTALDLPVAPMSPPTVLTQRAVIDDDRVDVDAIPETSPTVRRPQALLDVPGHEDELPVPMLKSTPTLAPNFQSSPPASSTRSRSRRANVVAPSTSSLSNLASTPVLTSSTIPLAQASDPAKSVNNTPAVANSSPVIANGKRRQATEKLPKLKTTPAENLRVSTRSRRRLSSSTDELSRSASATPTFEHSLRMSRGPVSKKARTSMMAQQTQQGPKILEGMAFAISFQSRRPGESTDQYNTRMECSTTIEKRIKQAGGRILDTGFDELFDVSPIRTATSSPVAASQVEPEISLTEAGRSTGFAALIADGHSRKVKYMQALALGLPCLASRWITTCLDRGELVDWTPFLLCAGQSAFLGNAVRSRNLAAYNPVTARLTDTVDQRTKLLEGSRILLVMKKALEGKKMAYVFLARVLGASMSRVYSLEEAKGEVKAAEDSGHPFDWVYVDGKEDAGGSFATNGSAATSTTGRGRKRKRASAAVAESTASEPVSKKIRTLSDELVIQSLILGRLIEEDEMEG
ncbi:hypothetical protein B0T25DRAFT_82716 [Lasiosphaeria hispida]|uniref:BRCT domain-containing protein n=1 Tax=Lasiosphaeria hispida TaxID=260671 RepID=A0AAJ0HPE8_9PEZI|nr:hypothetical protein B0T25DRAFT_82716 [Lasiosphaeria hispida]